MKYSALIMVVWCLVAGCATPRPIPVTRTLTANEEEQMLWRQAQEELNAINASGVLYQDVEIENYLNRIAAKLNANSISPDFSFQIKVVKDPSLNAFAFPNGVIYIHSGILARMDNEAQLAALLAHEMVHCTHRHSLRVLRSIKDRTAAKNDRPPRVRELAQLLGITGSIASLGGYTRELETEADRVGLDLAVKANYDPREILNLFGLLKQEIELEGVKEPYFFGTHPKVGQRIENVNNWLAEKYRGKITGIKNTDVFQSKISRLVLDNARLDLRQGRFFVAQRTVEKFLAVKQDDARAYFLLGEVFRQRGRQEDAAAAIKNYEKSISLNPSFPEPHKAMGLIHYKDGKKRLAKKHFESCLLLSPDTIDRAYIQGYLKLCVTNGEG
ncbi:MAG: M48 family metalloprotease [Desulfobacterales bacterium]